jgi:hypothetical protein
MRGFLLTFLLAVFSLVTGCDNRSEGTSPAPAPTVHHTTATTPAAATRAATLPAGDGTPAAGRVLPLFDGFAAGKLADFWLRGDYGAGRYAPGATTVTTERVRAGSAAVRITVKEGDVYQVGGDGLDTERAELDSGKHPFVGREVWYGFSFLVPEGFPVVDNRLVIAQWKQNGVNGGPLVAQRFRDGRLYLTARLPGVRGENDQKSYRLPPIRFGVWNDMVYHAQFSTGRDGRVEVWMNGKRVVTHAGANCLKEGENRIYNRIGLYRDQWKDPMTIYFDNYTMGEALEAVDPRRFDR